MSTFKKTRLCQTRNTPPTAAPVFTRPSRPFAPKSTPASEPVQSDWQAQRDRAARFGHSFSHISVFPQVTSSASAPQAGESASTLAAQTSVVNRQRMFEASATRPNPRAAHPPSLRPVTQLVQRQNLDDSRRHDSTPLEEGTSQEEDDEKFVLQRDVLSLTPVDTDQLGSRIQAARGGGHPLDEGVQRTLEHGLGADLSGVRIHTDAEAHRLSRSVNAVAFTTGADIFFRQGTYNPSSSQGLHLLAHEATHVVQQATGPVAGTPNAGGVSISDPGDRFERAAEASAARIADGAALQREPVVNESRRPNSTQHSRAFTTVPELFFMGASPLLRSGDIQELPPTVGNAAVKRLVQQRGLQSMGALPARGIAITLGNLSTSSALGVIQRVGLSLDQVKRLPTMSREEYYQTLAVSFQKQEEVKAFVEARYDTPEQKKGDWKLTALLELGDDFWQLVTDPGLFSSDSRFRDFLEFVKKYRGKTPETNAWQHRKAFNDYTLSPTGLTEVYRGIYATQEEMTQMMKNGLLPKVSANIKQLVDEANTTEKQTQLKGLIKQVGLQELHKKAIVDMITDRILPSGRSGPPSEEFTQSVTFSKEMAAAVAGRVRAEETQRRGGQENPEKRVYIFTLRIPTLDIIAPEDYVPKVTSSYEVVLGNQRMPHNGKVESIVVGNIMPSEIAAVEEWKEEILRVETRRLRPMSVESADKEMEELQAELASLRLQRMKAKTKTATTATAPPEQ